MKLIDYICQASGWTPVTREDENRPARDITPGSVVDVIVVDPYDDEFRILEKQTVLSVRPTADNDLGHDFVEVLIATDDDYGRGFDPFKIAAYRMVAKCEGTPEETIDKLEKAIGSAKKLKKIDWTEIDGLIVSLRMTCGNAVAIAPGEEIQVPLSLMGRKVVLKQDTDVMMGNILPAGASGFVIRHPSPLTGDNSIMYVGWDQRPSGFEDVDEAYNWFVALEDVDFVESPDTDGLPVVHLIGNLVDDDGVILMDGSVGFVVDGGNPNSQVLTVAFPEQDYRRFAGVVGGFDDLVFHHINGADLAFVAP